MLEANIRSPHETLGDIRSLVGAFRVATGKVVDFLEEYELDGLEGVVDNIVSLSEQQMRRRILAIPDGRYHGALDADGYDAPVALRLALDVKGDTIHCDFAGSSPQLDKPVNSVLNYTFAYSAYAIKCLLSPELPNNDGAIAPITVSAPEGSCLNPRYPAPTWARAMLGHYIPPLVFKALADVLPEEVCADSGSPIWTIYLRGRDARGNDAVETFFVNGGHGARAAKDGPSCLSFPSNVSNTPIEILEHRMPVLVGTKRLRIDSGGAGRTRGGLGQELSLTPLGDEPITVVIRHERVKHPPEGLLGGYPGARGADLVNDVEVAPKGSHVVRPGDIVTFRLPGGGGMHPPAERPARLVRQDVEEGLVSPEQAFDIYGYTESSETATPRPGGPSSGA
jgi:N-methylhydantoinase B